jgi:hypothetical protein
MGGVAGTNPHTVRHCEESALIGSLPSAKGRAVAWTAKSQSNRSSFIVIQLSERQLAFT